MNAADFGFVGSSYESADFYQDCERSINYFPEFSQNDKPKMPVALLGAPGKNPIIQFSVVGAVRGSWVLPGGTSAIYVSGNTAYLVTMTVPPTQNAIAQFSTTIIGTLLTNSGQVCIRDNGPGGYAVLVDGQYGYYYRIAGAGSTTFSVTSSLGSTTLNVIAPFPSDLIVGSIISDGGTIIPANTTVISKSINGLTLEMSNIALGSASFTATMTLAAWGQITDPDFFGADRIAFIDGWLLFNEPGTQNFYSNAPVPYTLLFDGLYFALKDSSSDNLITLEENNRELWLIGERTSEIWYDQGGAAFAFARVPGAAPQIGCAAVQSIARVGDSLMWLGLSERGQSIVVKTSGYSWEPVSTEAIAYQISKYPLVSDAFAFSYEEGGHMFYVLTFPTADKTWVYDMTSSALAGRPIWHERASYDAATGTFHRDRANCFANFQNLRLVGDYQSGEVHQLSREFYDDAGEPLVAVRRCRHIWAPETRERVFHGRLQIDFAPGVGLQTGQGEDPQAMLRWSDNAGASFGNEHWTTIGKAGKMRNRAIWRRLGQGWDRVYEVRVSDPVKRDVVGATLRAEASPA